MADNKRRKRRPTPAQIFAAALDLNARGSLKHSEAQLDGALACILSGFDDPLDAAAVIASAVARAVRMDAELTREGEAEPEPGSIPEIPEEELEEAVFVAIESALCGSCPCCGEARTPKAVIEEKRN